MTKKTRAEQAFSSHARNGAKILHLCGINDQFGNPRRIYLETPNNNKKASECRWWDEGYAGYNAVTDLNLRDDAKTAEFSYRVDITIEQYNSVMKTYVKG